MSSPATQASTPMFRLVLCGAALVLAADVRAQSGPLHDEELSWRTYASTRSARVRVYASPDERRPRTVVVDDVATNGGAITDEATFVADLVGREIGFDPTEATFVFRYTPASFVEGGRDGGKTLLLRATFRRSSSGTLGAPEWRVLTPEALDDLTDRAFR